MTNKGKFWTFLVLSTLLLSQPADAAERLRRVATATHPQRAMLKPLTPQVDMSTEPDPVEVFDQAVKEYSAGRLPAAEKLFAKVIELDPTNADAHFNMGAIKEWRNDWNAALMHYKAAQKSKPSDPEIAEAVRSLQYKVKNRTAIEAQMRKAQREQAIASHSHLAKEAFAAENYAEAVTHLSYLADAMPDDAKIQFALGQSLRALKSFSWAAYRLKMAIFLDPDNDLYRKALVELDQEIQDVQSHAFNETAELALSRLTPLTFTEVADVGLKHAF